MMDGKWIVNIGPGRESWYSTNKFDSAQQAYEYTLGVSKRDGVSEFQVGQMVPAVPAAPDAENMVYDAKADVADMVGYDVAGDWVVSMGQVADLQKRLDKVWTEWLRDNELDQACYQIVNVSEHKLDEVK